jgi:hypothetical protein
MGRLIVLVLILGLGADVFAGDSERVERSRELSQLLQQQLGAKLMAAMKAQGPVHAIEVCNVEAPGIAASLSTAGLVEVGRTAIRYRNPSNAPTAEQVAVMEDFAAQIEQDPSVIPERLITLENGEQHYMRAIVMQPQCLACHGKTIAEPVQQAIAEKYPNDKATGFEVGDLRGAFLMKWLSEE